MEELAQTCRDGDNPYLRPALPGGRWTVLILRDLLWRGPHGHQELPDANPGLSPMVLAERLRTLLAEGLVERIDVRDGRRAAVNRLTERGRKSSP